MSIDVSQLFGLARQQQQADVRKESPLLFLDSTVSFSPNTEKNALPTLEVDPITLYTSELEEFQGVRIAANKSYICYAIKGGSIRLILQEQSKRALLRGHTEGITEIKLFNDESNMIASVDSAGMLRVWVAEDDSEDKLTPRVIFNMTREKTAQQDHRIAWDPSDSNRIAVTSDRNEVLVWDIQHAVTQNGSEDITFNRSSPAPGVNILKGHTGPVRALDFQTRNNAKPHGNGNDSTVLLATGSEDGTVRIWDLVAGAGHVFVPHAHAPVWHVAFLGPKLLIGCERNTAISLWDVTTLAQLQTLTINYPQPSLAYNHITSDPESGYIIIADTPNETVYITNSNRLAKISQYSVSQPILSCTVRAESAKNNSSHDIEIYCIQTKAIQKYKCSQDTPVSTSAPIQTSANATANAESADLSSDPHLASLLSSLSTSAAPKPGAAGANVNSSFSNNNNNNNSSTTTIDAAQNQHLAAPSATARVASPASPLTAVDALIKHVDQTISMQFQEEENDLCSMDVLLNMLKHETADSAAEPTHLHTQSGPGHINPPPPSALPAPPLSSAPTPQQQAQQQPVLNPIVSMLFTPSMAGAAPAPPAASAPSNTSLEKPAKTASQGEQPQFTILPRGSNKDLLTTINEPAATTASATQSNKADKKSSGKEKEKQQQQTIAASGELASDSPSSSAGSALRLTGGDADALAAELQRFENSIALRLEKSNAKMIDRLEKTLNLKALFSEVDKKISDAVSKEIQSKVVPSIMKQIDIIPSRILPKLEQTIREVFETALNHAVANTMPKTVMEAVRQPVLDTTRQQFMDTVVPGFERATQNMFQQLNIALTAGITQALAKPLADIGASVASSLDHLNQTTMDSLAQLSYRNAPPQQQVQHQQQQQFQGGMAADPLASLMNQLRAGAPGGGGAASFASPPMPVVPVVPVDPIAERKREVERQIQNRNFQEGFSNALSASNLSVVMAACHAIAPETLFANGNNPLTQPVLLSLIQQLAHDLGDETKMKVNYLREALLVLEPRNAQIIHHIPAIIGSVKSKLDTLMRSSSDVELTTMCKLALMVSNSKLSEVKQ